MGLPLYIAPAEAERRNKLAARNLVHSRSSIRRLHRQNTDVVRESRRRRVLSTVASQHIQDGRQEMEREQRRRRDFANTSGWPPAATGEQILQRFLERARNPDQARPTASHRNSSSGVLSQWPGSSLTYEAAATGPATIDTDGPSARSPTPPPARESGLADDETVAPSDLWGPQTSLFGRQGLVPPSHSSRLFYHLNHNAGIDANDDNGLAYSIDGQVDHAFDDFLSDSNGNNSPNSESARHETVADERSGSRLTRHASSLRRSLASGSLRRSAAGWPDSDPIGRLRRPSPSRIFGQSSPGSGGGDANSEGSQESGSNTAASRQRTWAIQYYEPHPLPSIRTVLGNQVDGLGDRSRSLSPEGDSAWNTLLTTLTPDPQPPSVGSSFASVTAPTVGAPSASMTETTATDRATTSSAAPAPAVVSPQTSRFASEETSASTSASASVSTSRRVQSPFTVVSASTDTADESTILPETTEADREQVFALEGAPEPGCEDSEVEGEEQYVDMNRNHGTLFYNRASGQPWDAHPYASYVAHDSVRDGNDSRSRDVTNDNGDTNDSTNGDELLERLGISGMLNIVRNLARREDIPDELWAEAGLSRTLARGSSN